MKSVTSYTTIEQLRSLFASTGLPEELVSDNASNFKSTEFKDFMDKNGIKPVFIPAYHSASNGQAERSVQIVKKALKTSVGC